MAKVIVERPRLGDRSRSAASNVTRLHQRPIDEWHRREGMGTRYRRHTRWLNENLAPLLRFLRSRVGRPWDEVYSEICQRINRDSAVQLHVWQHLWDYVCKDAAEVDGRLVSSRDGRPLHGWPWAASFVVHPRTGALCLAPQDEQRFKRNYHRKAPPDYVPVDATHQYRRINGLWFEVELRPFPDGRWDFWDVVFRRQASQLSARDLVVAYGASMYAVGKRQLGKREIRRAGFDRQNGGR